jgi:hypothetical protein
MDGRLKPRPRKSKGGKHFPQPRNADIGRTQPQRKGYVFSPRPKYKER